MAPQVPAGSVAARILALLRERYPVTLRQVALALRLREDVATREAKRLAAQGLVTLEPLGGETYVALSGLGRPAAPAKPKDENDPAFG